MHKRYFTATYDIHKPSFVKDTHVGEVTVILVDIHPMVFYACFPHFEVKPGPMRHWSPIDPGDAPGVLAAFREMGGEERIYTLDDVHAKILAHGEACLREGFESNDANRRLTGLRAWATSIGLPLDEPRPATA